MSRRTLKALTLIAFMAAPVSAMAQGAVQQSGPVSPGHLACWAYNGIEYDCGSIGSIQSGISAATPITANNITNPLGTWIGYLAGIQNPNPMILTLTGGSLTGANATGNGVTNTLGTWTGYLAGLPNPNPVTFGGGAGGLGNFSITPVTPSIIPTVPQVLNFIQPTASGGSGIKFAMNNEVVLTGASTASWWTQLNQMIYQGTGGGSATATDHVAGYNQTLRNAFSAGGAANNPELWAGIMEMDDFTGQPSSATSATLTTEMDLTGHNVDNANNRQMLSGVIAPAHNNANFYEATLGYNLSVSSGAYVKTGMAIAGSYTTAAIDLRSGVSYAQNTTSGVSPTVTAPVTASVTVPVSNVMPFTSDIFGRDIDAGSFTTLVHFSDGQTATETAYTVTGSGPTPAGTLTLSAPITLTSGDSVFNSSNTIWLRTGNTIALDTNGATQISSDATTITLAATNTAVSTLKIGNVLNLKGYTVSTLPAASTAGVGAMAYVTDATSPTYNGALTGGGTVIVPVFSNGSSWAAH